MTSHRHEPIRAPLRRATVDSEINATASIPAGDRLPLALTPLIGARGRADAIAYAVRNGLIEA